MFCRWFRMAYILHESWAYCLQGHPGVTADAWLCLARWPTGTPTFKWGQNSGSALAGEAGFASVCMHASIIRRKMSPLFSLVTMPLSHTVDYALHRHVSEWSSTPFRLDPILHSPDQHVSEAKWRLSLLVRPHRGWLWLRSDPCPVSWTFTSTVPTPVRGRI